MDKTILERLYHDPALYWSLVLYPSEEVQNLNHRCNVEVHTIHLESSDLDIFLFEFSYPDPNSKYLCHVIRMFYSGFEFVLVVSNDLRILKCSIYFGTNKILQLKDFT